MNMQNRNLGVGPEIIVGGVVSAVMLIYVLLRLLAWEWLAGVAVLLPVIAGWFALRMKALAREHRAALQRHREHQAELEDRTAKLTAANEEMLRDLTELKQVRKTLSRQNEYMAALNETTLGVMIRLDLDELLKAIVTRACQLVGTPDGFLHLSESFASGQYRAKDTVIDCRVGLGIFRQFVGYHMKAPRGLSAKVWQVKHALKVDDYDVWSDRSSDVNSDVVGAIVVAPLKSEEHVVGVIGMAHRAGSGRTFDDEEVELLRRFAKLASIALDNARLYTAAQQARQAAEAASQAKSTFLANMSHELRTPLNAILGFSELMTRNSNLSPDQRRNLETIGRSGEHLLALINDVLALSKIEAGHVELWPKDFDLHHMILGLGEMFSLRAEDKDLTLIVDFAPEAPQYVRADQGKLRQVLINLLGNAVKFTHTGGVILRVWTKDKSSTVNRRMSLVFEVKDTGVGIAPDELDAVFDTFVQTTSGRESRQGTGLGLPISRRYVQTMGGELNVTSEPGRGTSFQFDLPVEVVQAADTEQAQLECRIVGLEPGQPAYRLLIVEDIKASRQLLVKLLRLTGFDVRTASNGQQAVEIWEKWRPHFIFMDMRMPVMDGKEATRHIKAQPGGQETVIVALTASAFEEDKAEVLALGCNDFVRKPFREMEIFDVLVKHLDVRFVYEGTDVERKDREIDTLDPTALAKMPSDWMAALRQATREGDLARMLALIEQVQEHDAALAEGLAHLAHNFEYDAILELIQ